MSGESLALELLVPALRGMLEDWDDNQIEYYFRLAYSDSDMTLLVDTNDRKAMGAIVAAVATRMKAISRKHPYRLTSEDGDNG